MKYFYLDFWKYVFSSQKLTKWKRPTIEMIFCRIKGHPGVIWYCNGSEPDLHCKRCGEDLS